jgi:hypothetical protein
VQNGTHGNSGEKMLRDDGFTEQKPLYAVKTIRNYLYVAIRELIGTRDVRTYRTAQLLANSHFIGGTVFRN